MELEAYELVLLRRPAEAPEYDMETLERIQREHIAYLEELRIAGHVVANGPVLDQADESLRGLTIYATGSLDEARSLAEKDPAVVAGRLAVEPITWLCRPGALERPGRLISIPGA